MRRRAGALLGVAIALAGVGVGAAVRLQPTDRAEAQSGGGGGSDGAARGADHPFGHGADHPFGHGAGQATVSRQDLVARTDVDGTLGYSGEDQVLNQKSGVLTGAAAAGTTVARGQGLYSVDNRMVPLFYGDLPAWRRLVAGVGDGPDVRQLEANLVALGYATEAELTVDEKFTTATTATIKKWQAALGVEQTGAVDPGDVIYEPGAVRIKAVKEAKGAALRPGGPVLTVTSTTRVVSVDLDVAKQGLVKAGDKVEVKLPDGKTVAGTVASVATVAKTSGQKTALPITVALDNPDAAGSLDEAPVRVGIVTSSRKGVLGVPVNALLALREGGYGVRVLDGTPGGRVVAVRTGLFAKGSVEISGEGIAEGTVVEVPAQ